MSTINTLVQFDIYMPRSSDLRGSFVLEESDLKILNELIRNNETVHLGEVSGKHSEVIIDLDDDVTWKFIDLTEQQFGVLEELQLLYTGFGLDSYIFDADQIYEEGYEACKEEDDCPYESAYYKEAWLRGFNEALTGKVEENAVN